MREARQLGRAGDHAAALARLEAALAIAPRAWRVECEAGFVAWRAEDLDTADRHIRAAMNAMPPGFVPEAERVPSAMCLFNAGLVAEARTDVDRARALWTESLRLRDNAAVKARLDALPARDEPAPAWQSSDPSVDVPAIVRAMQADFAASGLAGFTANELEPTEIPLVAERVSGGTDALVAHRIHADFHVADGGQTVEALVVRGAGTQSVALLGQAYSAGMSESSTELTVAARFEDVVPGGAPELLVETSAYGGSDDCYGIERHLVLCSVDSGSLRCITVPVASTSACGDEEGESEGYCVAPQFAGGRVEFRRCPDAPSSAPFIDGAHALPSLLSRGDLAWPATWQPLEPVGS